MSHTIYKGGASIFSSTCTHYFRLTWSLTSTLPFEFHSITANGTTGSGPEVPGDKCGNSANLVALRKHRSQREAESCSSELARVNHALNALALLTGLCHPPSPPFRPRDGDEVALTRPS